MVSGATARTKGSAQQRFRTCQWVEVELGGWVVAVQAAQPQGGSQLRATRDEASNFHQNGNGIICHSPYEEVGMRGRLLACLRAALLITPVLAFFL